MDNRSFEDLVNEAPLAPTAGTVSLVGTLARSTELGKFVLTLQGGSSVTLDTASVKSHAVLGSSVGHTIVRIDKDPPPQKYLRGRCSRGLSRGRLKTRGEPR